MSNRAIIFVIAVITAAAMVWTAGRMKSSASSKPVNYLSVQRAVENDAARIRSLEVVKQGSVRLDWRDPDREDIAVAYPDERSLTRLVDAARKHRVVVYVRGPPGVSLMRELIIQLLPLLLLVGVLLFLASRGAGMGKLFSGKRFEPADTQTKVTFADVAGLGEARAEVEEIVEFLKTPERFAKLGARVPRGVLFVGPPGTGKTLLAKAVAGESDAAFFSLTGSDFVEMLAGLGASRVRNLFKKARENAPAIIFIDEIDAVGRARSSSGGLGGHEEREQTLNQMLAEMDGLDPSEAVVVIAATNRPDVLDAALLRPGRFDRQIAVERPDQRGREEILRVHMQGKPIDTDLAARIAQQTPGFSGADLANLLNESAILAARRRQSDIDEHCVNDALLRVIAGLERKGLMSDAERTKVAYHEAGHALCAHYADHPTPVQKISIVSRGQALGLTLSIPETDRLLETRSSLMSALIMLMGGRAAELAIYGEASSGASNDLERATMIAQRMVTTFGMSDVIGPRHVPTAEGAYTAGASLPQLTASPRVAAIVEEETLAILREAQERAGKLLDTHRDALERVTQALHDHETIDRVQFEHLLTEANTAVNPPIGDVEE